MVQQGLIGSLIRLQSTQSESLVCDFHHLACMDWLIYCSLQDQVVLSFVFSSSHIIHSTALHASFRFAELKGNNVSRGSRETERSCRISQTVRWQIFRRVHRWPGIFHTYCILCHDFENCVTFSLWYICHVVTLRLKILVVKSFYFLVNYRLTVIASFFLHRLTVLCKRVT